MPTNNWPKKTSKNPSPAVRRQLPAAPCAAPPCSPNARVVAVDVAVVPKAGVAVAEGGVAVAKDAAFPPVPHVPQGPRIGALIPDIPGKRRPLGPPAHTGEPVLAADSPAENAAGANAAAGKVPKAKGNDEQAFSKARLQHFQPKGSVSNETPEAKGEEVAKAKSEEVPKAVHHRFPAMAAPLSHVPPEIPLQCVVTYCKSRDVTPATWNKKKGVFTCMCRSFTKQHTMDQESASAAKTKMKTTKGKTRQRT